MYETSSCLYENILNIDWYRVVCVACYVVGLIGFREQTIYNMTTDFGNHRIYSITIDFGHSLQYKYNWRLTQKLQDVIWLQFAKKKKKTVYSLRVISARLVFAILRLQTISLRLEFAQTQW